jgi:hypothetical protein
MPWTPTKCFGYYKDDAVKEAFQSRLLFPYASVCNQAIKDTSAKQIFLGHKILEAVFGRFIFYNQTSVGDCVAQSFAGAANVLKACQIFSGKLEQFGHPVSVEDLYHGARIIIGRGALGYQDGAIPVHMLQYAQAYGILEQKKYDSVDLSVYNSDRSRDWGSPNRSIPAELLIIAKESSIEQYTQVRTYRETCDMLYNGYRVTVASNIAFTNVRDNDGFARIDWNNRWPHQMYVLAFDDEFKRPGVLIMNSWPTEWIRGPKRHEQPEGSFWVDASDFERYVLGAQDSWSISNFEGYPLQPISAVTI